MNMGFPGDKRQLFRNFTYLLIRNQALFVAKQSVPSHVLRDGTSSQNSLLPHDLCRTVCVLQL